MQKIKMATMDNELYLAVRHNVPLLGSGSELTDLGASEISRSPVREREHHKAASELEASNLRDYLRRNGCVVIHTLLYDLAYARSVKRGSISTGKERASHLDLISLEFKHRYRA
jgi:hypothetical protein